MFQAAVITVSDKGSSGLREDTGGPLVASLLEAAGFQVVHTKIIPDEQAQIEATLIHAADVLHLPLVITTGGSGFSPRDVTPEATIAVCDRMVPGIPEAMRAASMKVTNRAMLSRATAGLRKQTLVINLPGSPKGAKENLEAVLPALQHALEMLCGKGGECAQIKD
jgi:molybdopterin adenylyltransferase